MPIPRTSSTTDAPQRLRDPNLVEREQRGARVRDYPRPNFQFAHHPDDWTQDGAGNLWPSIKHLGKAAGINAVTRDGDFSPERVRLENDGWILIPHDVIPGGYVGSWENRHGKATHRPVFETPINSGSRTTWVLDDDARREFLTYLREAGIIPAPKPQVVRQMLEDAEAAYKALRPPPIEDRSRRERYESESVRRKRQIEVLRQELAASEAVHGSTAVQSEGQSLRDRIAAARAALRPSKPEAKPKKRGKPKAEVGTKTTEATLAPSK